MQESFEAGRSQAGCGCCSPESQTACADTIQLSSEEKKARTSALIQFGLSGGLAALAWWLDRLPSSGWSRLLSLGLFALAYGIAGFPVFRAGLRGFRQGDVFNEMFLMIVASFGAFIIGAMEEAIGVMVFYRVGEYFMERATRKSHASIRGLLALQVETAHCQTDTGWMDKAAAEVRPGEILLIKAGEKVPVDAIVVSGTANLDSRAMTGETLPRAAGTGDEIASGSIVMDGVLQVRCLRIMAESSAARILQLVQSASEAKAKTELFITRFARWYTPAVLGIALLIATLPPLFFLTRGLQANWSLWVYRALVLLVISCPCALVLSVPLGYFAGLGGAARRGILIKGARMFDALADAKTVVFDKTGTLSDGSFKVIGIKAAERSSAGLVLQNARLALEHSTHPLAVAVREHAAAAANGSTGRSPVWTKPDGRYRELAGRGVVAEIEGYTILAGNRRLLAEAGVALPEVDSEDSVVHVAKDGVWLGSIYAGDSPKPGSGRAIQRLRNLGIRRIAMLTGDTATAAERVGAQCGISEIHAGLLPGEKLAIFESIISQQKGRKRASVLFVGDGTNDAPVLARSDAGLAMGGSATDAAIECADVVILNGQPEKVAETLQRAKRTRTIIASNIVLALGVKAVFMIFGGLGLAAMWEAVIADVGVALLAILNSSRALR